MPKTRVHENQLDLRRHLRAAERLAKADALEAEIAEKKEQLRLCLLQQRNEMELPQEELKAHYAELERLCDEEIRLMGEICKLEKKRKRVNFAGHSRFRTPAVEGFGLANAIREL